MEAARVTFDTLPGLEGPHITDAAIRQFGSYLRGDLVLPSDESYDRLRRIWNGGVNRYPAMIVRAAGVADVMAAVDFATTFSLPFSVRGAGHGVAGHAIIEAGMVIDISQQRGVHIDPDWRTARVEAGAKWGDLNHEAQRFNLATPGGKLAETGVAGTTLGGGVGWLMRKYGLSIDNLLSVDLVTAEGQLLTARRGEHEDLFWAVRGGGGNFGIVTSLEFQLHQVGLVYGGMIAYSLSVAGTVLRAFREYAISAPDDLTLLAVLTSGPDGQPMLVVGGCFDGPVTEGARAFQPLLDAAPALMSQLRLLPYDQFLTVFGPPAPAGIYRRWRSSFVRDFSDDLIDALVCATASRPSPQSAILIEQFGGAVNRVAATDTAFPHRQASFNLAIDAGWTDSEATADNVAWLDTLWNAVQPSLTGTAYVNFLDQEGERRVKGAYGPNYARLAAVKHRYDPDNVFRSNQNIAPASSKPAAVIV
jgi:FAD/FMN-containing dehydrogenase